MQNKILILTMFTALLFSGCKTMAPAVSIEREFAQEKELSLLINATIHAAQENNWKLHPIQGKGDSHTLLLQKTVKKRGSYRGRGSPRRWKTTHTYITIKFTAKTFNIDITDEKGIHMKDNLVSESVNKDVHELKDSIYLYLAHHLL